MNSVLGPYNISRVTVSGISSGGYMAVQLHVSWSSIFNGAAIFAGGPFYCAKGNFGIAESLCMDGTFGGPQVEELVSLTLTDEALGYIDTTRNLKDDPVYLFSGKDDSVVDPSVVKALHDYYAHFLPNIVADYNVEAEHCIPTLNYLEGEACSTLSSPYIGNCKFDGAGAALNVMSRKTHLEAPVAWLESNLYSFSQLPYIPTKGSKTSSIGDTGYIYIPSKCTTQTCDLHISLHGCEQNLELIGPAYARYSGFNEWAESNDIIVLYPYAKVSQANPLNPNGCWDWWGYTGALYGVQQGVQMQFIMNLLNAIKG